MTRGRARAAVVLITGAAVAGAAVVSQAYFSDVRTSPQPISIGDIAPPSLLYGAVGPVASRSNSGTLTVGYPAGTTPNDLVLLIEANAANQNISTPSGWTLLADQATGSPAQFRFTVWGKLAGGESSVGLSVNTNANGTNAWVARYYKPQGYPPNPASAATVRQGISAATATLTPSPDVTTTADSATAISIAVVRSANTLSLSSPQSFTKRIATTNNVGPGVGLGIADRVVATSGTTPPSPTWSQSGTAAQWAWTTVAYR